MELRAMTLAEYEEYLKALNGWIEQQKKGEIQVYEVGLLAQKWVAEKVYKVDPYTLRPGVLKKLADKTVDLTEQEEEKDEKNSVTSGNGE